MRNRKIPILGGCLGLGFFINAYFMRVYAVMVAGFI